MGELDHLLCWWGETVYKHLYGGIFCKSVDINMTATDTKGTQVEQTGGTRVKLPVPARRRQIVANRLADSGCAVEALKVVFQRMAGSELRHGASLGSEDQRFRLCTDQSRGGATSQTSQGRQS